MTIGGAQLKGKGTACEAVDSGSKGGSATSRPTWRQSELDAATDFPGYADQKSFINGKEVSYGTKGSVRPDYYKEGFSVDTKNITQKMQVAEVILHGILKNSIIKEQKICPMEQNSQL